MIKSFMLLLLLLCASLASQAKKYTDGYIVKPGNDTTYCKIQLANRFGDSYDLYRSIETIGDDGVQQTYRATDRGIRAFGFQQEGKSYQYTLMKDGNNVVFACKEETGRRLNLYTYCTFSNCGVGGPRRVKVWVMESRTLDAITISTGLFRAHVQNIRDFLYNDADLLPLYDEMVMRFSDIRTFVVEANRRSDRSRNDIAVSR